MSIKCLQRTAFAMRA